mgnify:CR=1 FL=1
MFTISREGVQDADRDGLLGANRSNSLAIARICNNADRPIPRLHTRVEIVNTLLRHRLLRLKALQRVKQLHHLGRIKHAIGAMGVNVGEG